MPTPEQIIEIVNRMERERSALHERMDKDFDRYNLVAYQGETDEDGSPTLDGNKKFTSNDPRTALNLALHLLGTAPALIRVRKPKAKKPQRELDNRKELFAIGILEAANTRRSDLAMPALQDALAAQCLLRGRCAQRVLLVKEPVEDRSSELAPEIRRQIEQITGPMGPRTRTYVDIQDWDPRNTYWTMGKHALAWACHKMMKTAAEIDAEYGKDLEPEMVFKSTEETHAVYDYFDETHNLVVMEGGRILKSRTPHGMGKVPVDVHLVGPLPTFQALGQDYDVHYGESFYQSDREMYDQQNFILSVLAELSKRSIQQGLLIYSADGRLTLESDPRVSGAETHLRTGQEDVKPLPPMEMVKESGAFMGVIAAMIQRGTFPASVFGDLAFQLSGFAIKQLRQGVEAPISPSLRTLAVALKSILNMVAAAYEGGSFDTMTLSGRMQDVDHSDFEEEIPPEAIGQGGIIEIELVPQMPQDDASKMALAQMASAGPVPILDHRFIREHILQLQDVEQVERAVQEQLARTGSPSALAFSNMLAAAEQGDKELAQLWMMEFQIQMMQRMIQMSQVRALGQPGGMGMGGGSPGAGMGGGGRPPGVPAGVAPAGVLGMPPPTPTPQAGPIAPPGTPRPGRNGPGLMM